jgi:hypothetical protein
MNLQGMKNYQLQFALKTAVFCAGLSQTNCQRGLGVMMGLVLGKLRAAVIRDDVYFLFQPSAKKGEEGWGVGRAIGLMFACQRRTRYRFMSWLMAEDSNRFEWGWGVRGAESVRDCIDVSDGGLWGC